MPETNPTESLRDRANTLYAQIDGAKEELAEYTRLLELDDAESLGRADNAFDKLSETIRDMQGPTVSDLLGRIMVLESSGSPDAKNLGQMKAAQIRDRAVIDDLQRENNDLRETIVTLNVTLDEIDNSPPLGARGHGYPTAPVDPPLDRGAVTSVWDQVYRSAMQASHDKLIGHYRAVLHDLSAPVQPAPEAARDGVDAAYAKANPLMAGGGPLGA